MFQELVEKAKNLLDPVGAVKERREAVRAHCSLATQLTADNLIYLVTITDLSLRGLRLVTPTKLGKDQVVTLALAQAENAEATAVVVWCKPQRGDCFEAGLRFSTLDEEGVLAWLTPVLNQLGFDRERASERRNFIRFPTPSVVKVTLTNLQGDCLSEGRLFNLGFGGALAGVPLEMVPGTPVRLRVHVSESTPAVDVEAVVQTSVRQGNLAMTGLKFVTAGPAQVRNYIRAVKKKLAN